MKRIILLCITLLCVSCQSLDSTVVMRKEWLRNKLTLDEADKMIKIETSTAIGKLKNTKVGTFKINGTTATENSKRDYINKIEKQYETCLKRWSELKKQLQDGDEIWDYIKPKGRKQLPNGDWIDMSRMGLALVREGIVLETLISE